MSQVEGDHRLDERWAEEFARFIETGDASDEFFAYLDENTACQQAVDLALKKKSEGLDRVSRLLEADERTGEQKPKAHQWASALAQALSIAARLPAAERSRVVRDAVAQAGRSRRDRQAVKAMAAELVEETAEIK